MGAELRREGVIQRADEVDGGSLYHHQSFDLPWD